MRRLLTADAPTPDHKSDILVTGGRLASLSKESVLEAHSSALPGRGVQAAMTFVVLTPEFFTLGDPLPLPTARDSDSSADTVASAEFDMIHPPDLTVKYAPEAIVGSLGGGGESGCDHTSHVSAIAQIAGGD